MGGGGRKDYLQGLGGAKLEPPARGKRSGNQLPRAALQVERSRLANTQESAESASRRTERGVNSGSEKEREMGVQILSMGKWLAAASGMIAVSAMAQDPKKRTDRPAPEAPAPANTAQPAPRRGNSQVDNKTYVIGESDVLD